MVRNA